MLRDSRRKNIHARISSTYTHRLLLQKEKEMMRIDTLVKISGLKRQEQPTQSRQIDAADEKIGLGFRPEVDRGAHTPAGR